jgi:hypothetical protein
MIAADTVTTVARMLTMWGCVYCRRWWSMARYSPSKCWVCGSECCLDCGRGVWTEATGWVFVCPTCYKSAGISDNRMVI